MIKTYSYNNITRLQQPASRGLHFSTPLYNPTATTPLIIDPNVTSGDDQIMKKIKLHEIHLKPTEFYDIDTFKSRVKESLDLSKRYSMLFRVCYDLESTTYKMLGRQRGLTIIDQSLNDIELDSLYSALVDRLMISMSIYKYEADNIMSIQILCFEVVYTDVVFKVFNNSFNTDNINKDLLNIPKSKLSLIDTKILPLSMDLNLYGYELNTTLDDDNNYIKHIITTVKGIDLLDGKDFLDLIKNSSLKPRLMLPKGTLIYLSHNKKNILQL
uniref:hypothetical protein n=1 Tax=Spathularia flavida TaxID=33158 RepID=UPI0022DCD97A|nr:hypothetical protein PEX43_mgp06 [Spathularia flavida]UZT67627.1 hypothetical protein [Spathularia flavida]